VLVDCDLDETDHPDDVDLQLSDHWEQGHLSFVLDVPLVASDAAFHANELFDKG